MRVALVTPYLPRERNGNAHTALRWTRFLRAAGHRVDMDVTWHEDNPAQALIVLHARRCHAALARYAELRPEGRRILVLTGTDLYRDIQSDADAQRSLELAHILVTLQDQGPLALPEIHRAKAWVIYQSAPPLRPRPRSGDAFHVCVVAHLRPEKDPFRTAEASALMPPGTRPLIWHIGGELVPGMADQARRYELTQPNWRWLGPRPHGETRARVAESHLLVVSSRMEGGANVIVEAVMAGTPVLASDIPGNRGMLGLDYAGYFPLEDSQALADLMLRASTDPDYYALLVRQCAARAPLFTPAREAVAVRELLA